MPSFDQHRAKAEANEEFAVWLAQAEHQRADWLVTVLFYSALHHIESLFRHLGIAYSESDRHIKRRNLLKLRPELRSERQLREDYFQLQEDSQDARYECRQFTLEEAKRLEAEQLARIRDRVAQLTS